MSRIFGGKRNRTVAGMLSAVAVMIAIVIGLSATLAAGGNVTLTFDQPNMYPTVNMTSTFEVETGAMGAFSAAVSPPNRALVRVDKAANKVYIRGGVPSATPGLAAVAYGTAASTVAVQYFQVYDPNGLESITLSNGGQLAIANKTTSVNAKSLIAATVPAGYDQGKIKWSLLYDSDVLSAVTENGNITPSGNGIAQIVGTVTDKWGVEQTIPVIVTVGPQATIVTDNAGKHYAETDMKDGADTIYVSVDNNGKIKAPVTYWKNVPGNPTQVWPDGNGGWQPTEPEPDPGILIPDPNDPSRWYRKLGIPRHVYEIVNKDGSSKVPPEYVYDEDKDDDPTTGNKRPAYPAKGKFYVKDPSPKNVYKPIDDDGNILDDGAIWGGGDEKLGTSDDKPAVQYNGRWFINLGQNIYQEINASTGGLIDAEFGAGQDGIPGTNNDLKSLFILYGGKYYAGPFKDADGDDYYIGDSTKDNNGVNTSGNGSNGHFTPIDSTDRIYYMDADGNMVVTKPETGGPGIILGINISGPATVEAAASSTTTFLYAGTVTGAGNFNTAVEWSVTGITGATMEKASNTTAYLKLPAGVYGQVTITAKAAGDPAVLRTLIVMVKNSEYLGGLDNGEEFTMDGVEWVVIGSGLGSSGNDKLIMTKYVHSAGSVCWQKPNGGYNHTVPYAQSVLKTSTDAFYAQLGQLRPYAIKPMFQNLGQTTQTSTSSGVKAGTETGGIMFHLSYGQVVALDNNLRIGYDVNHPAPFDKKVKYFTSTPYPGGYVGYVYVVQPGGGLSEEYSTWNFGMRPVMYVNFTQ